jgi:nitrite reductase/ring-hydroxylating ferredoxin subunit
MAEQRLLCPLSDLKEGVPREIYQALPDEEIHLIVGRLDGKVFAYDNVCPHQGRPLNWAPDRFLVKDGEQLVCAAHGATFELKDGSAVSGSCQGVGLKAVETEVRGGNVYLK